MTETEMAGSGRGAAPRGRVRAVPVDSCPAPAAAPRAAREGSVFVAEVTVLPVPDAAAQHHLLVLLDNGIRDAASRAFHDGQDLLLRAGYPVPTRHLAVHSVPCHPHGHTTVIALRWVATGPTGGPYPAMDANLELEPDDRNRSRLALRGSYRSPIAPTGANPDRIVLHRAARATARALLNRVGQGILTAHPPADHVEPGHPGRAAPGPIILPSRPTLDGGRNH